MHFLRCASGFSSHLVAISLLHWSASFVDAFAGNWSSGGGEIVENAQNPWFLDIPGTSQPVKYCVAADPEFPVPLAKLEEMADRTFRFWNTQFSNAFIPENSYFGADGLLKNGLQFRVNTSRYQKEPCSEDTELAFQFGYLTASQRAQFELRKIDLRRFVALTIQTDYGKNLRGKGFIYVSPDRGPMAFQGQNTMPEAWTATTMTQARACSLFCYMKWVMFLV